MAYNYYYPTVREKWTRRESEWDYTHSSFSWHSHCMDNLVEHSGRHSWLLDWNLQQCTCASACVWSFLKIPGMHKCLLNTSFIFPWMVFRGLSPSTGFPIIIVISTSFKIDIPQSNAGIWRIGMNELFAKISCLNQSISLPPPRWLRGCSQSAVLFQCVCSDATGMQSKLRWFQ